MDRSELDECMLAMTEDDYRNIYVMSPLPRNGTDDRTAIWVVVGEKKYHSNWMAKGASRDVYELGSHYVLKHMYNRDENAKVNPNKREVAMAKEYEKFFSMEEEMSSTADSKSKKSSNIGKTRGANVIKTLELSFAE